MRRLIFVFFLFFGCSIAFALPQVTELSGLSTSSPPTHDPSVREMLDHPDLIQIAAPSPHYLATRGINNAACAISCNYTDRVLPSSEICTHEPTLGESTTNDRGVYMYIGNSRIISNSTINISTSLNNNNGLIILWIQDSWIEAGGDININIGNTWDSQDCELIVYMRNVTFVSRQGLNVISYDYLYSPGSGSSLT